MSNEDLEIINRLIEQMNNLERNLMKRETFKKAKALIADIKEVEEQLKIWPTLRKGQLRYNYDTAVYREFGSCNKLIPDEIYSSFRLSVINALKVKHAALTEELENLQDDPVTTDRNGEGAEFPRQPVIVDGKPAYFDKGFD